MPVRLLGVVFMVLLALVITMAVQVVGTLLLFGLVVTPCATALLRHGPTADGRGDGHAASVSSRCWLGLVLSAMFNLPPSFFIVSISFVCWLLAIIVDRRRAPSPAVVDPPVDRHHPGHASVTA